MSTLGSKRKCVPRQTSNNCTHTIYYRYYFLKAKAQTTRCDSQGFGASEGSEVNRWIDRQTGQQAGRVTVT